MTTGPDPITGIDPKNYEEVLIKASLKQPYVENRPLAASRFNAVLILDRIFKLLTRMLSTLNKVAASQADRLTFLTKWQKAYTDAMNQVHAFIKNNGDETGLVDGETVENYISNPISDTSGKNRDDLNRVNANYTEQLRGNRSIISDDAKALQSNVNQSNDSVNQQSNMATSIIQEMSTILGALYR